MYINLEDINFNQNEIDDMDILYHLEKLGYRQQMSKSSNDVTEYSEDKPFTFDMAIAGIQ